MEIIKIKPLSVNECWRSFVYLNMAKRFNIKKIVNTKINKLLILSEGEPHRTKGGYVHRTLICKCECGNTKQIQMSSVLNNITISCGCYCSSINSERMKVKNKKHGFHGTPEYNIWQSMKKRCLNKNHKSYKDYGARGINICEEWVYSFKNFINDVGLRPTKNHSLDRIDNNKGYFKGNCKYSTKKEQARNMRNNVLFTYRNETRCVSEWCEIFDLSRYKTIKFLKDNG